MSTRRAVGYVTTRSQTQATVGRWQVSQLGADKVTGG